MMTGSWTFFNHDPRDKAVSFFGQWLLSMTVLELRPTSKWSFDRSGTKFFPISGIWQSQNRNEVKQCPSWSVLPTWGITGNTTCCKFRCREGVIVNSLEFGNWIADWFHYIHYRANTLAKGMNIPHRLPAMC